MGLVELPAGVPVCIVHAAVGMRSEWASGVRASGTTGIDGTDAHAGAPGARQRGAEPNVRHAERLAARISASERARCRAATDAARETPPAAGAPAAVLGADGVPGGGMAADGMAADGMAGGGRCVAARRVAASGAVERTRRWRSAQTG